MIAAFQLNIPSAAKEPSPKPDEIRLLFLLLFR